MEKKYLYVVRINYTQENKNETVTFITPDIEYTMDQFARNREAFTYQIESVYDPINLNDEGKDLF